MLKDLKVLVIDDDQDYRNSVRQLLETRGCVVFEAESGGEGLNKLVEARPDIIILDVMMDCSTDGYSVNQAIKHQDAYAEFRQIPIIMASSIEQSPDELFPMAAELEQVRPDDYLTKPLEIPRLFALLEAAAERSAARRLVSP